MAFSCGVEGGGGSFKLNVGRLAKVAQGDGGLSNPNVGRPTSKVLQGDGGGTDWNPTGPVIARPQRPTQNKACAWILRNHLPTSGDLRIMTAR